MSSKSFRPDAARVFNGPGEIAVDPDFAAEFIGEISAHRFQRRLHRAHDSCNSRPHGWRRDNSLRTWFRRLVINGFASFAILTNEWHETSIAFANPFRGAIQKSVLQIFFRREGDRMDENVQSTPTLFESSRISPLTRRERRRPTPR